MKVIIAASHRFHLLDLARELDQRGHDVTFYSYLPKNRAARYGLRKEIQKSLLYLVLPFFLLEKLFVNFKYIKLLRYKLMDYYVSFTMKECDVFIGLGTVYLNSFKSSKRKYDAKTILEWGSKHIIEEINAVKPTELEVVIKDEFNKRSLLGYEICDFIAIPSIHVKDSFIKQGVSESKLIINQYGVDLSMFNPTTINENCYDVIMVGGWSYRKGADKVMELFAKNKNLSFLHVGPIVDSVFPEEKNMHHVDPVDQKDLIKFYSKAKIFILLSRTEGLAMVQLQALACGLPMVCSKNTGCKDLQNKLIDKDWISIVDDINNINDIVARVNDALTIAENQRQPRRYRDISLEYFTWEEYGKRYSDNLNKI